VIVNYRQWRQTARLVRQLRAAACTREGAAEVVVVDNHSPPHRLAARLRRQPGVSLRRWGRNRGYGRAVNEGCRLSRGDWFLLLNPDVSVPEGFLDGVATLADRLTAEDERAGIVGFHLRNGDGTLQPSAGSFPTLTRTLAGLLRPRARRKYCTRKPRRRCRVSWVTGCCLLVRRECLRQLAGFDEDYFLYYEDVDLCRRAREQGWSVWYEPGLRAVHHHPLHGRPVSAPLRLYTRHALLVYAAKHWPAWQFSLLAGLIRAEAWLRRRWACFRGDRRQAAVFGRLGLIAADLAGGFVRRARRRLDRLVRSEERRGDSRQPAVEGHAAHLEAGQTRGGRSATLSRP
jgi:GT2 family glycosyltransferase